MIKIKKDLIYITPKTKLTLGSITIQPVVVKDKDWCCNECLFYDNESICTCMMCHKKERADNHSVIFKKVGDLSQGIPIIKESGTLDLPLGTKINIDGEVFKTIPRESLDCEKCSLKNEIEGCVLLACAKTIRQTQDCVMFEKLGK